MDKEHKERGASIRVDALFIGKYGQGGPRSIKTFELSRSIFSLGPLEGELTNNQAQIQI